MGASDLTTEIKGAGNGDVVDRDRPPAANGHVAKKRKRQKALAAAAANGHLPKAPARRGGADAARGNGAIVVDEPPAVEELDDAVPPLDEVPYVDELDDVAPDRDEPEVGDPTSNEPPARGRHARRRAAKEAEAGDDAPNPRGRAARRAEAGGDAPEPRGRAAKRAARRAEPNLRGRAARRAQAAERATPAARRAELVATAAAIAAAAAQAESAPASATSRRAGKIARRLFALVAIFMIPGAVYALAVTRGPVTSLSHADATYMSAELMTADQRVRRQLVRLRPRRTAPAVARTRDAILTARSLALELDGKGGAEADLVQRAVSREAAWLDAVGSVLSNPRSALRDELVARDAVLRPALAALPGPTGRRKGGAVQLVRYATSRAGAARRSAEG
jgi:hypothetical protein